MTANANAELEADVERRLGQCMLGLQRYEQMMKAILATHEIAGSKEALKSHRSARTQKVSTKTLGSLTKSLFESVLVPEGFEHRNPAEDHSHTEGFTVTLRYNVEMSESVLERTKTAIDELVAMRNDLVHHLSERYSLDNHDGCVAAIDYLDRCSTQIDIRSQELVGWATSFGELRAVTTSLLGSSGFLEEMLKD